MASTTERFIFHCLRASEGGMIHEGGAAEEVPGLGGGILNGLYGGISGKKKWGRVNIWDWQA